MAKGVGACVVKWGMHGKGGGEGFAWGRGACMVKGGVHGEGGCVWCRVGGLHGMDPPEIRPVIAWAVRILLECILVYVFSDSKWSR